MKYKSVIISAKGSPEVLQVIENELREPNPDEVQVKISSTGVGLTDVIMRYGYYPYAPKLPFAPGYEILGRVTATGSNVTSVKVGQRVAAITVHGGYAEYIYLAPGELVPVPEELDSAEAVSLILNYVTAYQMLHRVGQVKAGQKILITGAAGGVGTALLQLGKIAGLEMYGTASAGKHGLVRDLGGIPIDYKTEDFVKAVKQKTGRGVDTAFDGVGGSNVWKAYRSVAPKGRLVLFGSSTALKDGKYSTLPGLTTFIYMGLLKAIPDSIPVNFYGITTLYRKNPTPFREDLAKLFQLLSEGKIKPVIAQKLPLLEARRANEILEKGQLSGKIVLMGAE